VVHIKEPVGSFLIAVRKYEPNLGARAATGRNQHVLRKFQWYIFMSREVLRLKSKMESRMRVIDTPSD